MRLHNESFHYFFMWNLRPRRLKSQLRTLTQDINDPNKSITSFNS